ncbi:MAG: AvrD family protein [Canibacter sp.]
MNEPCDIAEGTPLSFESLLGPSRERFFSAGYKKVRQRLVRGPEISDNQATFVARVSYPEDWSRDSGGRPRRPHLSTVDAVILPLMALESLGTHPASRVTRAELRAGGTPWTDLDEVPVTLTRVSTPDAGQERDRFHSVSGNIRATFDIASPLSQQSWKRPIAGRSVYEELFRTVNTETTITHHDKDQGTLHATHHFLREHSRVLEEATGVDSGYWPCVSVVDHLVTMGQMAQALFELRHGGGRVQTLWMRSMTISLDEPPLPLPAVMESRMTVTRDNRIERDGHSWRDLAVESVASGGVRVSARLAYAGQQV